MKIKNSDDDIINKYKDNLEDTIEKNKEKFYFNPQIKVRLYDSIIVIIIIACNIQFDLLPQYILSEEYLLDKSDQNLIDPNDYTLWLVNQWNNSVYYYSTKSKFQKSHLK